MNSAATSSFVAVIGSAAKSVRWIRISSARCSEKSIAFLSSSPSFLSMLPSCCTSSTSIRSSSCDILLSELRRKTFASSFFQREKRAFSGVKIQIRICSIGAENMAHCSAQSLAMLFGEISPKISTTTVTTTVEIEAPISP